MWPGQRCLKKILLQKATLVIVTPLWTTHCWFPAILPLCIDYPRLLPQTPDLPLSTANKGVPSLRALTQLVACHILGDFSKTEDFQMKVKASSKP